MTDQLHIQQIFEELLAKKFSQLQPINKWRQTMWHLEGKLVVSLIHLSKKSKFCFFNNPNLEIGKVQRWGSTTYSNNVEVIAAEEVDWKTIDKLLRDTILTHSTSKE